MISFFDKRCAEETASRLMYIRIRLGFSIQDMNRALGLSPLSIKRSTKFQDMEQGKRKLTLLMEEKLLQLTGLTRGQITGSEELPFEQVTKLLRTGNNLRDTW